MAQGLLEALAFSAEPSWEVIPWICQSARGCGLR